MSRTLDWHRGHIGVLQKPLACAVLRANVPPVPGHPPRHALGSRHRPRPRPRAGHKGASGVGGPGTMSSRRECFLFVG